MANPYAAVWLSQPGYSCAQTLATDHAMAECSDGKRGTSLKEVSISTVLKRALSLRHLLEQVRYASSVDGSLPGQKSGFLQVIVMGHVTEQKRRSGQTDHGISAVI